MVLFYIWDLALLVATVCRYFTIHPQFALGRLQVGVAGAAGDLWSNGPGPSHLRLKASEYFWKEGRGRELHGSHALRPRSMMVNASTALLQGIGCNYLDYKKRCSSVTQGSDDRRRNTGNALIGRPKLYRVSAAVQTVSYAGAARRLSIPGFNFFRHRAVTGRAHLSLPKQSALAADSGKQQQS